MSLPSSNNEDNEAWLLKIELKREEPGEINKDDGIKKAMEDQAPAADTSILHHAFISIFIALWDIITHYVSILMAILSYFTRFTMKMGECRQLEFWLEQEQILETYSAQLQKS